MLAAEFERTIAIIGDRPIASLVDLPALNDPEIAVLQDVLQEMFSPTYQLGTNNFGITVMRILQNSIEHGISRNSIYAYVNSGTLLCARLDIEKGHEFGRAAVRLDELHPDKKSESMLCNMWGAWVQHWKDSYEHSKASLRKGIHAGVETGQYIWAFYNTCNACMNSLLRGRTCARSSRRRSSIYRCASSTSSTRSRGWSGPSRATPRRSAPRSTASRSPRRGRTSTPSPRRPAGSTTARPSIS
ncbi:hypothetical protein [Nannocystis pusilla]|uniref:hypothetical protein n=1 Tax=Nannocystis pusilla TaxID=889268 RepID=UPI003B800787